MRFNRFDPQSFQSPENYNLPSSTGATGRDKISICAHNPSLTETLLMRTDYIFSILCQYNKMLPKKVKWNQHEISNDFCNNEWFWYCFISSQHILKITHGHLLIEQYSLGKAIKGESKHTPKAQYIDYVLSPCAKQYGSVWTDKAVLKSLRNFPSHYISTFKL